MKKYTLFILPLPPDYQQTGKEASKINNWDSLLILYSLRLSSSDVQKLRIHQFLESQ